MDPAELDTRIGCGEDLHTEFKEWPIHRDKLAATLVAFANAEGGVLLLGVDDNGGIVGVEDADQVMRFVDAVAFNNCVPPISVGQEVLAIESVPVRRVVVVSVPRGDMRPYCTQKGNTIYIRTGSGRRPASREEILRLYQASGSLIYDEKPLPQLTFADLDLDAFENYLSETGLEGVHPSREQLLVNWRLLSADRHPTLAGMILFGRHPQRHLPFAQINAARIPGTQLANDPSDRKDLTGRLFDVIDQAERFLSLHLPVPHRIHGFEPERYPELPEAALREAIVNAVAHRDYTIPGPVRLFVFDDRVEIHAPGKPPNTVDEGAMRVGVHVPRNPVIYKRLADLGLVTRVGSGIPRMIELVKKATGRDLEIAIRDFEVTLVIPRQRPTPENS